MDKYLKNIVEELDKNKRFFGVFRITEVRNKKERTKIMTKNFGFTLSEVLITLGVIGVVAAITMPTLITKYEKMRTVSQLKKSYNIISNALQQSIVDNDEVSSWNKSYGTVDFVNKYFAKYMKIIKTCPASNTNSCMIHGKWLNGSTIHYALYTIITADGAKFNFNKRDDFMDIFVDIDGENGKNVFGRDIFCMRLYYTTKGKIDFIEPLNSRNILKNDKKFGCNRTATSMPGHYCGALIMYDGWKISDDYPW